MIVIIDTHDLDFERLFYAIEADPELIVRALVNQQMFKDDYWLDCLLDDVSLSGQAIDTLDSWMCEYAPKLRERLAELSVRDVWVARVVVRRHSTAIELERDHDEE